MNNPKADTTRDAEADRWQRVREKAGLLAPMLRTHDVSSIQKLIDETKACVSRLEGVSGISCDLILEELGVLKTMVGDYVYDVERPLLACLAAAIESQLELAEKSAP